VQKGIFKTDARTAGPEREAIKVLPSYLWEIFALLVKDMLSPSHQFDSPVRPKVYRVFALYYPFLSFKAHWAAETDGKNFLWSLIQPLAKEIMPMPYYLHSDFGRNWNAPQLSLN
jgi:hypothetical protein